MIKTESFDFTTRAEDGQNDTKKYMYEWVSLFLTKVIWLQTK